MSNTVSGKFFRTLPAIGLPMFPTPMKPTDVAMLVSSAGMIPRRRDNGASASLARRGCLRRRRPMPRAAGRLVDRLHAAVEDARHVADQRAGHDGVGAA